MTTNPKSTDKATPRPWLLHANAILRSDSRKQIAAVILHGVQGRFGGRVIKKLSVEDEANARLIVASVNHAEKLAEALRALFEWHFIHMHGGGGTPAGEKDYQTTVRKARAALAAYEKDLNAK